MDPIKQIVEYLIFNLGTLNMVNQFRLIICSVSASVLLVSLLFNGSPMDGIESLERSWYKECNVLLEQIRELYPVYNDKIRSYTSLMCHSTIQNNKFINMVRSVSRESKIKAEKDYCLHDINNDRSIETLRALLESITNKA